MDFEELKALIEKATENFNAQKAENDKTVNQLKALGDQYATLKSDFDKLKEGGDADGMQKMADAIEDLQGEMEGVATKLKNPVNAITDEKQKEAIREVGKKAIGAFYKMGAKMQTPEFFEFIQENAETQCKTLNISNPAQGGLAVAEVLDRDVMDYGRDFSIIMSLVGQKPSLTRSYRQMIKVTYPSVAEGIENVAGTVPAETSTQTYKEVKAKEFKLYVSPRITNEALMGTDIDVYSDLTESLGEEVGIYISAQLYYGDGQDKNCRGMLSSNRLDITNGTGESWLPTLTPDGTGSRNPDFFPAYPTGVDGAIATSDKGIVDWLITFRRKLPTRYRANAVYVMHEDSIEILEKVRDADDRPIFKMDYRTGDGIMLFGKPVLVDNTLPVMEVGQNRPFVIYGDVARAFAMAPGDVNQMLLDPYTKKGSTIVYMEKEYFEIMQRSDAIIVGVATTNGPA